MNITFQNEFGTISMTGGGKGAAWKIREITGLGIPERSFAYNTYAGVAGQELSSVSVLARTITINVDIDCIVSALSMSRAARILNADGRLVIRNGIKCRAIDSRCISFTKTEKRAAFFEGVLQFTADNPYFHDCEPREVIVAEKKETLTFPFTLPTVFSTRVSRADVVVSGDCASEPVITVRGESAENSSALTVTNETTGACILLNHGIVQGETIEINIPNRTVTLKTEQGESTLIGALSNDSYLGGFVLNSGANRIRCETEARISAKVTYDNNYLEAMYE